MINISAKQSMDWRSGEELDALASIVSPCQTWLTLVADNVGFDGYSVADLEMGH